MYLPVFDIICHDHDDDVTVAQLWKLKNLENSDPTRKRDNVKGEELLYFLAILTSVFSQGTQEGKT